MMPKNLKKDKYNLMMSAQKRLSTTYIVLATSCQKNAISSIVHCTIMCTQVTFQASYSLACTFADVAFENFRCLKFPAEEHLCVSWSA